MRRDAEEFEMSRPGLKKEAGSRMQSVIWKMTFARERQAPPVLATAVIAAVVVLSALTLPIIRLAELTNYLVLSVFMIANLALVRIKLRDPEPIACEPYDRWSLGAGYRRSGQQ